MSIHPAADTTTVRGSSVVQTNCVIEFEFTIETDARDPWSELELTFEIVGPGGIRQQVQAFWAGESTWRLRYSSGRPGAYRYQGTLTGPATAEGDLAGEFSVVSYHGDNALLVHGGPRVADDGKHLAHADGEPFFWLADTWWTGMIERYKWPDVFQTLTTDRAEKGFTVVQIVAGLVPEFVPFDDSMRSEGGQLWDNHGKGPINPHFFDVPDEKINHLVASGISPCIVGAWGYWFEFLGRDNVLSHWRYLVARFGAYPVSWCIAGEVDMQYERDNIYESKPVDAQVNAWKDASRLVAEVDPYKRLRTVHPCPLWTYSSSDAFPERDLFDFDMLQTGHTGRNCVGSTMTHLAESMAHGDKPVFNGECSYEGIFDSNWGDVQRFLFWSHMLSGTCGHTYGTMPISTFNSREAPHLPLSRVSMHYWDDAIDWSGARQVGIGRRVLETIDWWTLQPIQGQVHPSASPDDWFLPYAARSTGGATVLYLPALSMLDPHGAVADWPTTLSNVRIDGFGDGPHDYSFVNPRDGSIWSRGEIEPEGGVYTFESKQGWIMPTGEDWVLVVQERRSDD